MAATYTFSGNPKTLLGGEDFERIRSYITCDQPMLTDPDTSEVRVIGEADLILAGADTTTFEVDLPGNGWTPSPHFYTLHVEGRSRTSGLNRVVTSQPFQMTADMTLADLPQAAPMAITVTDYESLIEARDEAVAAAESVTLPTDGIIAGRIEDPESATAAALLASNAEAIEDPETAPGAAARAVAGDITKILTAGQVVLFKTTSIGNGSNSSNASTHAYPAVVRQILGSANISVIVHGQPSETFAQIAATLDADLAAYPEATHVHFEALTNSAGTLVPVEDIIALAEEVTRKCRLAGRSVSFGNCPPKGAGADADVVALGVLYNQALERWCHNERIGVADYYGALVGDDGYMRPEYADDETHPEDDGHRAMAFTLAPVLRRDRAVQASRGFLTSPLGLIANPLFEDGTTGWPIISGAATTRAVVDAEPGDGLRYGKWHRLYKDNTAGGVSATVVAAATLDNTKYSAGDVLIVHGRINHSGTDGGSSLIVFRNDLAQVSFPGRAPVEIPIPGEILTTITVPASPGTLRICHSATAPAGGVIDSHVGEIQIINATTGEIVDFV